MAGTPDLDSGSELAALAWGGASVSSYDPDRAGERSSADEVLPDTSVHVCDVEVADRVWDELGRMGDGG